MRRGLERQAKGSQLSILNDQGTTIGQLPGKGESER
jgi:hypothetical protein